MCSTKKSFPFISASLVSCRLGEGCGSFLREGFEGLFL